MANEYDNYASFGGLSSVEDKAEIEENVRRYPIGKVFWQGLCDHKEWKRGYKRFSWRRLVKPNVAEADLTALVEGVAPSPDKMTYAEYEASVHDYGRYIPYTKEAVQFNKDNVIDDISHTISYKAFKVPETIVGKHFTNSKVQITPESTVVATLDKAAAVFAKNEIGHFSGTKYFAILTPDVFAVLKGELRSLGDALPEAKKSELYDGTTYDFDQFEIAVRGDDFLTASDGSGTTAKIIFLGTTDDGLKSEICTSGMTPEIIVNHLGFGVIKDSAGNVVSDANHRVGSVAYNLDAFGVGTQADYAKMTCDWTVTKPAIASAKPASVAEESNFKAQATAPTK